MKWNATDESSKWLREMKGVLDRNEKLYLHEALFGFILTSSKTSTTYISNI